MQNNTRSQQIGVKALQVCSVINTQNCAGPQWFSICVGTPASDSAEWSLHMLAGDSAYWPLHTGLDLVLPRKEDFVLGMGTRRVMLHKG